MEKKIIITIGRQFGSGGKSVAVALGNKLNIPVYDNELISKAAEDYGFSKEIFSNNDEKKHIFKLAIANLINGGGESSSAKLFAMQSETIRRIAEQGSAIIVGRASNYILRDLDCTLNIFLTAPIDNRIGRVCERTGMPADKAKAFIEKQDKDRASFYNYFTFGDWGAATNYDLCIDSSKLGIDGTADFIINFAKNSGLLDE